MILRTRLKLGHRDERYAISIFARGNLFWSIDAQVVVFPVVRCCSPLSLSDTVCTHQIQPGNVTGVCCPHGTYQTGLRRLGIPRGAAFDAVQALTEVFFNI